MGIPGSANPLLFGGAAVYEIEQSLRFGGGTYLQRTVPLDTSTQDRYVTYSVWFKKATNADNYPQLIEGYRSSTDRSVAWLDFDDTINYRYIGTGTATGSTGKLRDPAAWYHYCVNITSTSTGHEVETFLNGASVEVQTSSTAYQNYPLWVGGYSGSSTTLRIGTDVAGAGYDFEGYMAEAHLIGGTIYDATKFGEYDDNGVWRPIEVTGVNYGNEGWYLKFDPSATNGIGHDHSGNGNNFTASGFVTSGTGTDVMSDTPTTNWCTLNPLEPLTGGTMSDGNLQWASPTSTPYGPAFGTTGMTEGKYYWEVTPTSLSGNANIGIIRTALANNYLYNNPTGYAYRNDGQKGNNSTTASYGSSYSAGDIIGVAYDATNGTLSFYKNGVSQGDAYTGLSGLYFPGVGDESSTSNSTFVVNFGQRAFEYTPPTGFKALNTSNLPAPDIADGSQYFNTVTYAGDGSTQSITGVGFQSDFTWIKARNQAENHYLADSIRGAYAFSASNTTGSENSTTNYDPMSSFDSDGFTVKNITTSGNTDNQTNDSGVNYVAWNWLAANGTSSNTAGSITSTVSANPSAGFSIVTYTGTGSAATVGHGLGVAPSMITCFRRDAVDNRYVYHSALGSGYYGALNSTAAFSTTNASLVWNSTEPTSTVFSVGTVTEVNGLNATYVAYCFAEVEGYSKIGSYTGNGNNDGPFVYTGFRPAFVLTKRTDSTSDWVIQDSTRQTYNPSDAWLLPNSSNTEGTTSPDLDLDFLSNGFKVRNNGTNNNINGSTYIFMALAENPFGGDGVSPATAR
jgi:hypothetical protein